MMHKIAATLNDFECYFTPFYAMNLLEEFRKTGFLKHTILDGKHLRATSEYLNDKNLPLDVGGKQRDYDLVLTGTDLIVQSNIRNKRLVLVQEGITVPDDFSYWMIKNLKFPRFLANTAATGLSNAYDRFCVASPGYREYFISKGIKPEKIIVTGIPNFDHANNAVDNTFPYKNYILVATSSIRESGKFDDRIGFLRKVKAFTEDKQIIFKLHPNEKVQRAEREIRAIFPQAIIFSEGNTTHMVANCDVLITQVSSVVYWGMALGKEVHSYFDQDMLKKLQPIQNNGTSACRIADVCRSLVQIPMEKIRISVNKRTLAPKWSPFGFD
ncbi:MAG: hypothetical protein Q7U53_02520 [Anaerolineaceae bacterium]|nr:hypothetical protein [Anaerolineaceae bacterium]